MDTKISNEITKNIVSVKSGPQTLDIGNGTFTVIAGPCSIESESQFLETALAAKNSGATLLRGGIWKLRTSIKNFQGLGEDAFHIVKTVTEKANLSLVSEITDARQIEVMYPLVSMFQVGSRNMYNYSLLKELSFQDKPVLLKRGFSAFIPEWIKAAEYVEKENKSKVILCERGIRTFETTMRNTLDLNAVAYIKKFTHYPIIVDPSHGVGISALVPDLALAAVAMGADGVIIEVHPSPKDALSDGQQSLTLKEFDQFMDTTKKILAALDKPLQRLL